MFASLDFLEPDDFDDDFSDKASNTTWLNSFWDRIKKIGTKLCLLK